MVSQASWSLLLGLVGFTCAADPVKLKDSVPHQGSYVDHCTPVPTWSINGEKVVNLIGDNVTVIALLNSERLFGRRQAGMLNLLCNRFYQAGFPSITFMVIDSASATENVMLLKLEAPNIPVYQKQQGQPVQDVLGACNDQVLVFDRCGRLAYQVITPFSNLTYCYVKAAILSTYSDNPCGICNRRKMLQISNSQSETIDESILVQVPGIPGSVGRKCHNELKRGHESNNERSVTQGNRKEQLRSNTLLADTDLENARFLNYNASDASGVSNRVSLRTDQENATFLKGHVTVTKSETSCTTREVEERKVSARRTLMDHANNETTQKQYHFQVANNQENLKNWDWSQTTNQVDSVADLSDEQSVEVVPLIKTTNIILKKTSKPMGLVKHLKVDTVSIESLNSSSAKLQNHIMIGVTQESSEDSSVEVMGETSMEELVNQTQRLFDWHQKQAENGLQTEKEYERSNIFKLKIIEHYNKLLPWLNCKLTPKVRN